MADPQAVNLPDMLGAITGGERVNISVMQCALGVRPRNVPAGQPFEVILLLQNASDADVDVSLRVRLPERDANQKPNRFFAQRERLLVGLRPAEVGYVTLPASSSPKTATGEDYQLVVDLGVKVVDGRKPRRVRAPAGGGVLVETELSEEVQERIWELEQMVFSTEQVGRSSLAVSFGIKPSTLGTVADFSPGWTSLWTMRDHVDERLLVDRVRDPLVALLPRLKRDNVFFPLLDRVQTRFRESGGYPLRAGEAVVIAKLLTLVLEQGVLELGEDLEALDELEVKPPAWLVRTCRVLFDRPEAAQNAGFLATELIFDELMGDAIRLGLTMVGTVLDEDFGDEQDQDRLVDSVMTRLESRGMDFQHTYLPLVMGGLIANARVVMPQEKARETIWLLRKNREQRASEQDETNASIFQMVDQLIDRALDRAG